MLAPFAEFRIFATRNPKGRTMKDCFVSSAGSERLLHTQEVRGSNPRRNTKEGESQALLLFISARRLR